MASHEHIGELQVNFLGLTYLAVKATQNKSRVQITHPHDHIQAT